MITVQQDSDSVCIVIEPNRSSDWRTNQLVIAVLGSVCISIALAFYALMGIWMILPFAGLEVLALGAGLYYVSWKLHYRQLITLSQGTLTFEKGVYRPRGIWHWPRTAVTLKVQPARQQWSPATLLLQHAEEEIPIGEFLNKDDANELSSILAEYIQVRRERPRH